jgi:hypothetical protein
LVYTINNKSSSIFHLGYGGIIAVDEILPEEMGIF